MRRPDLRAILTRFILTAGLLSLTEARAWAVGPDSFEVKMAAQAQSEDYDRNVDKVALQAQQQAINKLSSLLKKYRNTPKESVFLAKLGDLQQQLATIHFRIAHGDAHRSKRALDLSKYKATMKEAIATLSRLISKYPDYEELAHSLYLRGKSYEEIGDNGLATQDYLRLVKQHPNAEEVPSAYMSLAEFAISANNHLQAVNYLMQVEKLPDDPHYPFALYKLAWANYNLKRIPEALKFAEKQIAYYNKIQREAAAAAAKEGGEGLSNSDIALKENTLLDLTTFYLEGLEEKMPAYAVENAYEYFKNIESGPILGGIL